MARDTSFHLFIGKKKSRIKRYPVPAQFRLKEQLNALAFRVCVCGLSILVFLELLKPYHLKTNRVWPTFPQIFFLFPLCSGTSWEQGKRRWEQCVMQPFRFKRVFKLKKNNISWQVKCELLVLPMFIQTFSFM